MQQVWISRLYPTRQVGLPPLCAACSADSLVLHFMPVPTRRSPAAPAAPSDLTVPTTPSATSAPSAPAVPAAVAPASAAAALADVRPAFDRLGLGLKLVRAAAAAGWQRASAIRAAVIPAVLAGRDVLGNGPTGSGKTAAFVLPALQRLHACRWTKPTACSTKALPQRRSVGWRCTAPAQTLLFGATFDAGVQALAQRVQRDALIVRSDAAPAADGAAAEGGEGGAASAASVPSADALAELAVHLHITQRVSMVDTARRPMACTQGARSGEPARSQVLRCVPIALSAAYRWEPASVGPRSGDRLAVVSGMTSVRRDARKLPVVTVSSWPES